MPHYLHYSMKDYGGEVSGTTINIAPITLTSLSGLVTAVGALRAAIEGVTLGVMQKEKVVMDDTFLSRDKATDKVAQRELKWLVTYEGVTNHRSYDLEIPTADPSLILAGTKDQADLTAGDWPDFITIFENASIGRVPGSDTEAVQIVDVRLVGRNL